MQKLISTRVPRSVQDIPYFSLKVTKRTGGRLKIEDMVKYDEKHASFVLLKLGDGMVILRLLLNPVKVIELFYFITKNM